MDLFTEHRAGGSKGAAAQALEQYTGKDHKGLPHVTLAQDSFASTPFFQVGSVYGLIS